MPTSNDATPISAPGLVSLADIKEILGITSSADDDRLQALLDICEAAVIAASPYVLTTTTFTEYYSGSGGRILILRRRPVQSITSIYLDSEGYFGQASGFDSDHLLVEGEDYALRVDQGDGGAVTSKSGLVHRIGTVWPNATLERPGLLTDGPGDPIGNIKVTYVAGFEPAPGYLVGALAQMVGQLRANANAQGIELAGESFEYYSYNRAGIDQVTSSLISAQTLLAPLMATKSSRFLI